jgi:NAD(P)-dependent dehydrogenase (short-subunit alcohol dehydrogenase family)
MQRLQNKVSFITGGTSGIGFETAKTFIKEGATVIITGRHKEAVDNTVKELGKGAFGFVSDAGKMEDISRLPEQISAIAPKLDIVFINAGYGKFAPVEAVTEQMLDEIFNVLVKGAFFTVQSLLPSMSEGGNIIFNTSVVTRYGSPYASVYSAAKAAVASFVKTFAAELTARKIRVNGISPGYTETDGFNKTGMSAEQINDVIGSVIPTLPFKRFAKAVEIANAVSFLASDEASYLHGTELAVDGGYTVIK